MGIFYSQLNVQDQWSYVCDLLKPAVPACLGGRAKKQSLRSYGKTSMNDLKILQVEKCRLCSIEYSGLAII